MRLVARTWILALSLVTLLLVPSLAFAGGALTAVPQAPNVGRAATPPPGRQLNTVVSNRSWSLGRFTYQSVKRIDENGNLIKERSWGIAPKVNQATGEAKGYQLMRQSQSVVATDGSKTHQITWLQGRADGRGNGWQRDTTHVEMFNPDNVLVGKTQVSGKTFWNAANAARPAATIRDEKRVIAENGGGGNWKGTKGNSAHTVVESHQEVGASGDGTYHEIANKNVSTADGKQHAILRFLNHWSKNQSTTETHAQTVGGVTTGASRVDFAQKGRDANGRFNWKGSNVEPIHDAPEAPAGGS